MVTNTENTIGRIGLKEKQGFDFGLSGNEVPVIPRRQLEKSCFILMANCKIHLGVHCPNVTLQESGGNRT